MIIFKEPEAHFRDIDRFIMMLGCMETEQRRVHTMPKGDTSIRSASQQGSVHVWHPEYMVDIYFSTSRMSLVESAYGLLKKKMIALEDIEGYDIEDFQVTFYLSDGAKYGFKKNEFTVDFYKIEDSTPELVDENMVKKHLSQGRRAVYGIPA